MPFDAATYSTNAETITLLERARHRLRKHQLWCKKKIASDNRVCALGALEYASDDIFAIDRAVRAIHSVTGRSITHWNDDNERKHKDVLATFDRAIANLRGML